MVKRVLFLLPTLGGGGSERVVLTLLRHIDRSKFRPELAVVNTKGAVLRQDIPTDVELFDLGCARVRYALYVVAKLIVLRKPRVVVSTLGHLNLALALIRPLLPNGPVYFARESTVVSENLQRYGWPGVWRWLYRAVYKRFDAVICQSEAMRDDLVVGLGLPSAKAVLINNPVDTGRIRNLSAAPLTATAWPETAEGGARWLAVGRLGPEKGYDVLLEALAREPDAASTLLILGDGPLRTQLQDQSERLGLGRRVEFGGFQHNPYKYLARADALLVGSRFEGFPNAVLEALACGTPVIAVPGRGGLLEILRDCPECLVAADMTAEAMAIAMQRWRDGPRDRVPVQRVARYEVSRIVAHFEALFERAGESGVDGTAV